VGARPQRLLWVSARSGESEFSTHRFASSAMAPETIAAMRESALHAHSARLATKTPMRSADLDAAERMLARFAAAGIDINALSGQLQQEGGQALTASWKQLLKVMTDKTGASKESATALA
jgi:transaldolase